ncbi:uncharacterized protein RSE6_01336 [Rhynchosporium secalis]|nr:uncharacterized protein RSE6_01336 [Rhynchosporium secalis]
MGQIRRSSFALEDHYVLARTLNGFTTRHFAIERYTVQQCFEVILLPSHDIDLNDFTNNGYTFLYLVITIYTVANGYFLQILLENGGGINGYTRQ